jgi:hypothetical protein
MRGVMLTSTSENDEENGVELVNVCCPNGLDRNLAPNPAVEVEQS